MNVHTVNGEARQDGRRVGMVLAIGGWEEMPEPVRELAVDSARRLVEMSMRADGVTGEIEITERDYALPDDDREEEL